MNSIVELIAFVVKVEESMYGLWVAKQQERFWALYPAFGYKISHLKVAQFESLWDVLQTGITNEELIQLINNSFYWRQL